MIRLLVMAWTQVGQHHMSAYAKEYCFDAAAPQDDGR